MKKGLYAIISCGDLKDPLGSLCLGNPMISLASSNAESIS
jgi:hypothetical protein